MRLTKLSTPISYRITVEDGTIKFYPNISLNTGLLFPAPT